jgi:hypothetical protein
MCRARILTIAVIFSKRLQIHDYDFFGATTIGVVCAAVWYPPPPATPRRGEGRHPERHMDATSPAHRM